MLSAEINSIPTAYIDRIHKISNINFTQIQNVYHDIDHTLQIVNRRASVRVGWKRLKKYHFIFTIIRHHSGHSFCIKSEQHWITNKRVGANI